MYLHTLEDHKTEAFINAVDVVVHLHDPSRSSTEDTAPPLSAHIHLDDVLAFLTSKRGELVDEFRQHNGVVMVLVKNNLRKASPKHYKNYDGG